MAWHDGPALLDRLETIELKREVASEATFAMPVQWVSRPDQNFRGYAGSIVRRAARVGAEIVALPSGRRTTIARIIGVDGDVGAWRVRDSP